MEVSGSLSDSRPAVWPSEELASGSCGWPRRRLGGARLPRCQGAVLYGGRMAEDEMMPLRRHRGLGWSLAECCA